MRQLIGKSIELVQHALFPVFSESYKSVRLKDVIQFIRQKNVNEKYIEIIGEVNSRNRTREKPEHRLTEEIVVSVGISQISSISSWIR